jgi:hypothetical protein
MSLLTGESVWRVNEYHRSEAEMPLLVTLLYGSVIFQ